MPSLPFMTGTAIFRPFCSARSASRLKPKPPIKTE
jgi:hypothetical protein